MKRCSLALVAGLMVGGMSVPGLAVEFDCPVVTTVKEGKDRPKGNDDPIVPVNGKPNVHQNQHSKQNQPKPKTSDDPIVPINLQPIDSNQNQQAKQNQPKPKTSDDPIVPINLKPIDSKR